MGSENERSRQLRAGFYLKLWRALPFFSFLPTSPCFFAPALLPAALMEQGVLEVTRKMASFFYLGLLLSISCLSPVLAL